MVGVAEKVTEVPLQTGLLDGEIETLTGRFGLTTIVIIFDVAGLLEIQTVIEEVRTQVTWSPLTGTYEYAGLLAPELIPFTFHW